MQPKVPVPHDSPDFFEDVQINGHIIDSLILPKILDLVTASGGSFRIKKITIGQARSDPSYALIEVRAPGAALLSDILGQISDHGAVPTAQHDCQLVPADMPAPFPRVFIARPTSGPKSASAAAGSRLPIRKWTAASRSTRR